MALVLLGLIIFPSGLLGYFSWRALENEKLLSQERLQESYHQFARLAAREIDDEIANVERRWASAANETFSEPLHDATIGNVARLVEEEPLIAACYVLAAPGKVIYPSGSSLPHGTAAQVLENEPRVREHDVFEKLVARGEEFEYRTFQVDSALAVYRHLLTKVGNPQLRGMAEVYIGRALMKKGEWEAALKVFQDVLANYAEMRDLNDMHLRFLAQYQIAVALENLDRDREAVDALLQLNRDLLDRSDAINPAQYTHFVDQIRALAPRLLASPNLSEREGYVARFRALGEQSKKQTSQRYFLQLLDRKLNSAVIERKHFSSRFRYLSDEAADEPYLLAYRFLPDVSGNFIAGIAGLQINLAKLEEQLFPSILQNLRFSDRVMLAILNEKGDFVIGTTKPMGNEPIAARSLSTPFDLWQVAVYLTDVRPASPRWNFRSLVGLWFISLLLLSILSGAYFFIRRAQREAKLSQMKSTFVSNLSHELRTPLASIKMLAELMEMQMTARNALAVETYKTRIEHYLSIIRRESERLGRLIESLLNFSKIERGVKQYEFEYEDPMAVLSMALESFRLHAEAQGFKLDFDGAESLPEVRMDADAITQVMLNLLNNAVKYSDQVKEIHVRTSCRDGFVVVEVRDCGIGIPASEIPKIFEDFYRVDQRLNSHQQGGVGLGLTLVRHIVNAHGGAVSVRSEVGRGSTFTFTLPIAKEPPVRVTGSTLMADAHEEPALSKQHLEPTP
jgi:signal transduction histidine kinase